MIANKIPIGLSIKDFENSDPVSFTINNIPSNNINAIILLKVPYLLFS